MKHFIEPGQFTNDEYNELIATGLDIMKNPKKYSEKCKGMILGSLFFEPSTRTKFSFDAAMLRLGGNVMGFSDANSTSSKKGESLADTIRIMSGYVDIIAMRHPYEGAALLASNNTRVPIINGGDGGHQHPTQTLTDLITIVKYKGTLEGHTIALIGDLKYGRTVHSLIKTLARFNTKKFYLVSPKELRMPSSILEYLKENHPNLEIEEVTSMEEAMPYCDILYMTRIQKERFFNEADYLKLKNSFLLNKEKMKYAKEDAILMHPLPRVNEIATDVDSDPRAVYFDQAINGMYIRMALIMKLLEV
ncbi:aspartate carbamoyltransferase [Guggenheimella bovis]